MNGPQKSVPLPPPTFVLNFSTVAGVAVAVGLLVTLTFFVPYASGYMADRATLAETLRKFWNYEQWQHCWLVLPAIGVIVYTQRQALAAIPLRGALLGVIPLGVGLALFWVGARVENYYIGFFSLHLLVAGFILWFCGWRWFGALLFPLGFMIFLWPLFFLEERITFPLRMIMAEASAASLNGIGIPVVLNGTGLLSAPDQLVGIPAGKRFSVDVADPCSGIRSLFALMMVSALYGHFALKGFWKKWLLFAASVPMAILGNLCRILMLTVGTLLVGPEVAIGTLDDPSFFHMFAGYLVFAVALSGMLGLAWLLENWRRVAAWRTRMNPSKMVSRSPKPPAQVQEIY